METEVTNVPEKRYFYYLDSGTGEVSIELCESREHINEGAWWIPSEGSTCYVDKQIFTDRKKLNLIARELILNLRIRAMRVESNYEATKDLYDLPVVE